MTTSIPWEKVQNAIRSAYAHMERAHINGWTEGAITDNVCYALRDAGVEVTDIPRNCMESGPYVMPDLTRPG